MKREALARIADAQRRRRALVAVTRLSDGAQCLVDAESIDGELSLSAEQLTEARSLLSSGRSASLSGALPGAEGLFARAYVPSPRMLIVGAVHIAQALAPMADAAGFEVIVIDPRGAFASPERFPGVQLSDEWPDEALGRLGLDDATALVALSHDPKLDDPALELALPGKLFYIGALGSRRTHEKRLERLRAAGLGELVGRIHSPIGLDLGGRSPAEIAVAILAEVIQVRYKGERGVIFGEFPLAECEGMLLAHSLHLPDRIMKKGRRLTSADCQVLGAAGILRVTGARLDAADLDENAAAGAVAAVLCGAGIAVRAAHAGRCNLYAAERGLVTVNADIINRINRVDESVTVATLPPLSAVRGGAVVATVKIIPLAVSRSLVAACIGQAGQGALALLPFRPQRAALIVTEQPNDPPRNTITAVNSSRRRLEDLGSHLGLVQRCAHRTGAVAAAVQEALAAGCSLILIAGATVPKDRTDTVPAGIVAAGGEILHFGMPVEPGNMLLLARVGAVPVIILPGCARSRRSNGLDWVLQRMLAGLPMGPEQIMAMGVGGLIRSPLEVDEEDKAAQPEPVRAPVGRRVAALVLAAGRGERMGSGNKLLQAVGGVPMVRRAANAALASRCTAVTVVTGFAAEEVQACLAGLEVDFAHNAGHATGMASSLRCGLAALPADVDAVVVLLADMPCIHGGHIDRLIAAFDPQQAKIVVPMKAGRRGNPILWPRAFFAEMQAVEGDVGARDVLRRHADRIEAVAFDDDAIFADVDTPAALEDLAGR